MTPELKPSCSNCKHFLPAKPGRELGNCRRQAPQMLGWPWSSPSDICGEWLAGVVTIPMTCSSCKKEFSSEHRLGIDTDKPFRDCVCRACDSIGKDFFGWLDGHPVTDYAGTRRKAIDAINAEIEKLNSDEPPQPPSVDFSNSPDDTAGCTSSEFANTLVSQLPDLPSSGNGNGKSSPEYLEELDRQHEQRRRSRSTEIFSAAMKAAELTAAKEFVPNDNL